MMLSCPRLQPARVGKQVSLSSQPILDLIKPDETTVSLSTNGLGEFDDWVKEILDRAHCLAPAGRSSTGLCGREDIAFNPHAVP